MNSHKKTNIRIYLLMLWMAIVPLASSAFITILIFQYESAFSLLSIVQWVILFALSAFTMALAITPTTYIALVSGYFIGFSGIFPLVIAYQAASIVGFLIAKKADEGFIVEVIRRYPKSEAILQNVQKNQFLLTILSRLSPALPFALMNVVLSSSKVRLFPFFWGGLIGMLPRSLFCIWVGIQASKLSDAFSNQENIYLIAIISVAVILAVFQLLKIKK